MEWIFEDIFDWNSSCGFMLYKELILDTRFDANEESIAFDCAAVPHFNQYQMVRHEREEMVFTHFMNGESFFT